MKLPNWGRLFHAFVKAAHDLKANAPRPSGQAPSGAEMAASLREIQAQLPAVIAALEAHPGYITAVDDILAALAADGFTWAAPAEKLVDGGLDALRLAQTWLPKVLWAMETFREAPVPRTAGPVQYPGR